MKAPRVIITNPLCKAGFARGNQSRLRSPQPAAGPRRRQMSASLTRRVLAGRVPGNRQCVLRTESAGVVAIGDESGGDEG
jgi:hypothetical protein